MTDEPKIVELLEQILDSGCTPEEACAQFPEFLTEVHQRLKRIRSIEKQIDALFPSQNSDVPQDTDH